MKRGRWMWGLAVCFACTAARLDVGADHPAAAAASSAPLPTAGSALAADFDPQPLTAQPPGERAAGAESHGHVHSAPEAETPGDEEAPARWTCPMHPEVVRREPGKCPICGMKLEPVPSKKPTDGAAEGSP